MPSDHLSGSMKRLVLTDLSIGIIVLALFAVFKEYADYVLLITWTFTFSYLLWTKRFNAMMHQILATFLSMAWIHYAKGYYDYKLEFLKIFGLNSLPLLAWTMTLFGLHELCSHCNFKKPIFSFLVYVFVFWFFGILFETVAYHTLGIRNSITGNYAGLPVCDCVHAPRWMQVVYMMMGPFYYSMTMLADRLFQKLQIAQDIIFY